MRFFDIYFSGQDGYSVHIKTDKVKSELPYEEVLEEAMDQGKIDRTEYKMEPIVNEISRQDYIHATGEDVPEIPVSKENPSSQMEYLQSPSTCPCCGSDEITGGCVEIDGSSASQAVSCHSCGANWNDIYKLTGYDDLDTSECE